MSINNNIDYKYYEKQNSKADTNYSLCLNSISL